MRIDRTEILRAARRFEHLARVIKEKPEAVREAVLAIAGEDPGIPDPFYMSRSERDSFLAEVADKTGISAQDVLDIYGMLSVDRDSHE